MIRLGQMQFSGVGIDACGRFEVRSRRGCDDRLLILRALRLFDC